MAATVAVLARAALGRAGNPRVLWCRGDMRLSPAPARAGSGPSAAPPRPRRWGLRQGYLRRPPGPQGRAGRQVAAGSGSGDRRRAPPAAYDCSWRSPGVCAAQGLGAGTVGFGTDPPFLPAWRHGHEGAGGTGVRGLQPSHEAGWPLHSGQSLAAGRTSGPAGLAPWGSRSCCSRECCLSLRLLSWGWMWGLPASGSACRA